MNYHNLISQTLDTYNHHFSDFADWIYKNDIEGDIHNLINEPESNYYSKASYPFQDESYHIIRACMEVHKTLGAGFHESGLNKSETNEFR